MNKADPKSRGEFLRIEERGAIKPRTDSGESGVVPSTPGPRGGLPAYEWAFGDVKSAPEFAQRLKWFLNYRPDLARLVSRWEEPGRGSAICFRCCEGTE